MLLRPALVHDMFKMQTRGLDVWIPWRHCYEEIGETERHIQLFTRVSAVTGEVGGEDGSRKSQLVWPEQSHGRPNATENGMKGRFSSARLIIC